MATGLAPTPSLEPSQAPRKPTDSFRFIDTQLRRTRGHVKTVEIALGLLYLAVGALVLLLIAIAIDHWVVRLSGWARWSFLGALVAGSVYFAIVRILPPLFRRVNPIYAAQTIERSKPSLKNSLINLLLFRQQQQVPETVYRALEEQAARGLVGNEADTAVDRTRVIHAGYALVALVAAFALYLMFSPKNPLVTVQRVVAPWSDIAAPSRVSITDIKPGTADAFRGQPVTISAEISGLASGEDVVLYYTTADRQSVNQPVPMRVAGEGQRHTAKLPEGEGGVQQDFDYRIEAGDAVTSTYHIRALATPTIVVESVDYRFPAYTGMQPLSINGRGDVKAIEGTEVTIHALANQPIKSGIIDFDCDNKPDHPLQVKGQKATYQFKLELKPDRTGALHDSYQLRFTNDQGAENPQPVHHRIEVVPDLPPEVVFIAPEQEEIAVPVNGRATLELRALDPDFALSSVAVQARTDRGELIEPGRGEVLKDAPHAGPFTSKFDFAPARLNLQEGDVVRYRAVAIDNKTPDPNQAATPERRIRIVAAEQVNPRHDPNAKNNPNDGAPNNGAPQDQANQKPQNNDKPPPDQQAKSDQQTKRDQKQPQPGDANQGKESSPDKSSAANQNPDDQQSKNDAGDKNDGAQAKRDGRSKPEGEQKDSQPQPDSKADSKADSKKDNEGASGANGGGKSDQKAAKSNNQGGDKSQSSGGKGSEQGDSQGGSSQPNKSDGKSRSNDKSAGSSANQTTDGGQDSSGNDSQPSGKSAGQKPSGSGQNEQPVPSDGRDDGDGVERILKHQQRESGNAGDAASDRRSTADGQPSGAKPEGGQSGSDKPNDEGNAPGQRQQRDKSGSASPQSAQDKHQGPGNTPDQQSPGPGGASPDKNAMANSDKQAGKQAQSEGTADGKDRDPGDQFKNPPQPNAPSNPDTKKPSAGPGAGAQAKDGTMPDKESSKSPSGDPGQKPQGGDPDFSKGNAGDGQGDKDPHGAPASKNSAKPVDKEPGEPQPPAERKGDATPAGNDHHESDAKGQDGGASAGADPKKQPGTVQDMKTPGGGNSSNGNAGSKQGAGDRDGGGGKGGGQKANTAGAGAAGEHNASDEGRGAAAEAGKGEKSDRPGGDQVSDHATGQSGDQTQSGSGSSSKPADSSGEGQSGGASSPDKTPGDKGERPESGQKSDSQNKQGKSDSTDAGKSSAGDSGQKSGGGSKQGEKGSEQKPASQSTAGGSAGSGSPTAANGQPQGNNSQPAGPGAGTNWNGKGDAQSTPTAADDPNLSYAKKATELALDHLKQAMKNGKQGDELLKDLGWSREEAEQFIQRQEERLRAAKRANPNDDGRRQAEDALRSLGLRPPRTDRSGNRLTSDSQQGMSSGRRTAPPPEYMEQYKAFSQGVNQSSGK